jgi:O-antigen/teichoic acid export membrane protein
MMKRITVETLWVMGVSYMLFAVNFFSNVYIATTIGPHANGIFVFIASIQIVLCTVTTTPLNWIYIRSDGSQAAFDTCWRIGTTLVLANAAVGAVGGAALFYFYDPKHSIIFALLCVNQALSVMALLYTAPLERRLEFRKVIFLTGGTSTGGALAACAAAASGAGVWSLMVREVMPVVLLWTILPAVKTMRWQRAPVFQRPLVRECIALSIVQLTERGFFRAPLAILGALFGPAKLGNYNQAFYVATLPNTLLSPITERIAFPALSKASEAASAFSSVLNHTSYLATRLSTPVAAVIAFTGEEVFAYTFGEEWRDGARAFAALALFAFVAPIYANLKTACCALGKQHAVNRAYILATATILTGVVSMYLADASNLRTVAWVAGLGALAGLLYLVVTLRAAGIELDAIRLVLLPLVFVGGAFTLHHVLPHHLGQVALGRLVLNAVVIVVAYGLILTAFERKRLLDMLKASQH